MELQYVEIQNKDSIHFLKKGYIKDIFPEGMISPFQIFLIKFLDSRNLGMFKQSEFAFLDKE